MQVFHPRSVLVQSCRPSALVGQNGLIAYESAIDRGFGCGAHRFHQKSDERITRHLAGCHGKLVMLHGPSSDDTADRDVVRRVEECHMGSLTVEQSGQIIRASRIAAHQAVFAQLPKIPKLRNRLTIEATVVELVCGIF